MLILKAAEYTKPIAVQAAESPTQAKAGGGEVVSAQTQRVREDVGIQSRQTEKAQGDEAAQPKKTDQAQGDEAAQPQKTQKEQIAELLSRWMEDSARAAVWGLSPRAQTQSKSRRPAGELDYLWDSLPKYDITDCVRREMEAYKKQLENCTSKQAVHQRRNDKLQGFVQEAYGVIKSGMNAGERLEALGGISARVAAAEEEYVSFTSRLRYKQLPDFPPKPGQKVCRKETRWVVELRQALDRQRKQAAEERCKKRRLERRA